MILKQCKKDDFIRVCDFYRYSIDNNPSMKEYCPWIYGLHPNDEMIKEYIDNGYLFFTEKDGEIIAAVALTPFQDDSYNSVNWSVNLKPNEVSVVHILCVSPKYQGQGIAKEIIKKLIEYSKAIGKNGIRLDALSSNKIAHRLYEGIGFRKCDVKNWYAGNTGWTDFYLFEYYWYKETKN